MKYIVIYGGSFNPPCLHHVEIVRAIATDPLFHEIVVIPCGLRAGKSYVDNDHRMCMVQNAFGRIPGVILDLRNIKDNIFTSNYHLEYLYRGNDVVLWHAIGSDLLVKNDEDLNPIQQRWTKGRFIWENFNFLIMPRNGFPVNPEHLPMRHIVLQYEFAGSSTNVRDAIRKGKPCKHLVDPETYNLILNEKLYQEER